jgi:peptidoglycan hydrolase-like protein with peptidoglycan-binding domain
MRLREFSPLIEDASFKLVVPKTPADISNLQRALQSFEYDVEPNGKMDSQTVAAVKQVQQDIRLPVTGNADDVTISAINDAMTVVPGMLDYMSKSAGQPSATPANKPAATPAVRSTPAATVGAKSAPSTAVSKGKSVIIGNEKRTGGSISWRANNPGNVMYGPVSKRLGALGSIKAADGEPVAIMPTLEHGWKLAITQWRRPKYNNLTINQGCRIWATAVGKYTGISPYTLALANAAGVSVHTKVSELSDAQLINMVKRQAKLEGFKVGTVTTV